MSAFPASPVCFRVSRLIDVPRVSAGRMRVTGSGRYESGPFSILAFSRNYNGQRGCLSRVPPIARGTRKPRLPARSHARRRPCSRDPGPRRHEGGRGCERAGDSHRWRRIRTRSPSSCTQCRPAAASPAWPPRSYGHHPQCPPRRPSPQAATITESHRAILTPIAQSNRRTVERPTRRLGDAGDEEQAERSRWHSRCGECRVPHAYQRRADSPSLEA